LGLQASIPVLRASLTMVACSLSDPYSAGV
jgi:hypothetical protein